MMNPGRGCRRQRIAAADRCGFRFDARLRPVPAPRPRTLRAAVTPADRALAEHRIREASELLGRAGQAEGAGDVAALGDLLAVAAEHSPALVRVCVRAVVDAFERPCPLPPGSGSSRPPPVPAHRTQAVAVMMEGRGRWTTVPRPGADMAEGRPVPPVGGGGVQRCVWRQASWSASWLTTAYLPAQSGRGEAQVTGGVLCCAPDRGSWAPWNTLRR